MVEFPTKDNYIYKFVPFSINTLKLLTNGKIYFGTPHNLNDPFEGEFSLDEFNAYPDEEFLKEFYEKRFEFSKQERERRLAELKGKPELFKEDLAKYIKKTLKSEFGVSCFSKNPHNILMWSHYADSLRGMCLVFDKDLLLSSLKKSWLMGIELTEVKYELNLPTVVPTLNDGNRLTFSNLEDIFITKFDSWKYEEEIRLHYHFTGNQYKRSIPFDKKSLIGIIIGENMDDDEEETIIRLIKGNPDYKVIWGATHKNLEKKNIDIEHVDFAIDLKLDLKVQIGNNTN